MLSVDEISYLLALDFERYESLSQDVCAFPCFSSSYDEVISPKSDIEEDVNLEYVESSFEGVFDESSNVHAHYDTYLEEEDVKIGYVASSFSSCFHETEIVFDCSYDEEDIINREIHFVI